MTLTIENSSDLNGPGKPGRPSQNSENRSGQSPRSNPVCLEVSLTIRSLPSEPGSLIQPIREEARTVIVFDNGAVIRSTSNMPAGQKIILSGPSGRDVVCQVVGGRNLPSVKGYVEVEFLEPVNDFWSIHQSGVPVAVAAPPASPLAPLEAAAPPLPGNPVSHRAADPLETPAKQPSVSLASGPTFNDIPGLKSIPSSIATPESKTRPERSSLGTKAKDASGYDHSENANHATLANWRPSTPEPLAEKRGNSTETETLSLTSPAPAASRDFMSKGLMAYEQPRASSGAANGRAPLIIGVAAIVLAGICAVVFFVERRSAPASVAPAVAVSHPSAPDSPVASSAPEPAAAPQEDAAPVIAPTQTQPQPVAVDPAQPGATPAAVPAVVTSAATSDSRTDTRPDSRPDARNVRRQDKNAGLTKQADVASARRPAIPNLKMGSPSAPNKNLTSLGEGTAPITDIAATEPAGGTTPAGLLTAAGRTFNPPAAPPSALAPAAPAPAVAAPAAAAAKTVREPKLISSTRLVYPTAAKQSNVQGIVTVVINVDATGKVVGAKALSGPLLLRQAAVESVQQWKYSPGLTDGRPTPSQLTVNLDFRLK